MFINLILSFRSRNKHCHFTAIFLLIIGLDHTPPPALLERYPPIPTYTSPEG